MTAWNFIRPLTQYDRSKVSVARGARDSLGLVIPLAIGAMAGGSARH